ncbi:MAG TPA: hypothetical protein VGQ95_11795 [Chthoniobacterales bacterium]|jgi:hypothetical protein|nr:hypothetical protein [Chthoniobacterales bacterium]HXM74241.1 hypothetical protein [Chthoniobacterales bacterium]
MLFNLFILLGVAVLAVALRSFQSSFAQKAGALAILTVSYLLIYFTTGSHILGAIAAAAWFFLPWVEILTRIRTLRLPKEKQLRRKSPPSADIFPSLNDITREIENEGFAHVNDAGWDWEDYRQFFRLFYKDDDRAQATICLNEQHDLSFYYLRISSRAKGGTIWTTWNYPLSYGLKLTPHFRINRQRPDQTFWQLYQSHREFLRRNSVQIDAIAPLDEERIQLEMENDLRDQIAHNIDKGVLKQTPAGDVKYSWRGMIYLWCQFLLDLVRL